MPGDIPPTLAMWYLQNTLKRQQDVNPEPIDIPDRIQPAQPLLGY